MARPRARSSPQRPAAQALLRQQQQLGRRSPFKRRARRRLRRRTRVRRPSPKRRSDRVDVRLCAEGSRILLLVETFVPFQPTFFW